MISGASAGAVNAVLLADGLIEGGRPGARARLRQFWQPGRRGRVRHRADGVVEPGGAEWAGWARRFSSIRWG